MQPTKTVRRLIPGPNRTEIQFSAEKMFRAQAHNQKLCRTILIGLSYR